MRIQHPYSMLCSSDHLASTCGQAPIGETGEVLFPGNLLQQCDQVISTVDRILDDAKLNRQDIERIVVFTCEQKHTLRQACVQKFRHASSNSTVYPVQLPPLFYDDLLLEVDYYITPDRAKNPAVRSFCVAQNLDSDNKSLSRQQSEAFQIALETSLRSHQLRLEDVVKLTCYAPCRNETFWDDLATARNQWFGQSRPVISDVVTEYLPDENFLLFDFTCVENPDWGLPRSVGEILERGNPEALRIGPLFFTSALFSESTSAPDSFSVSNEVNAIMKRHSELLASEGLRFDDVIKATTFYDGAGSSEALHENMSARNTWYKVPGPGSTGLPVSGFSRPTIRTTIDLIASS
ncbi:MAG: hypothetical protein GY935_17615 [Gammaproteobacteria bacterium]|nr:hypothetical protein [Gammaproteobacteria bacterium]